MTRFLILCLLIVFVNANCYKNSTGRGVGKPITSCPAGKQLDAGLCYDPCQQGYTGVGPVCWQICPAGFTDTGAFCQPDTAWGDNSQCPWHDKCGLISAQGCVKCPAGMSSRGCVCAAPGSLFAKNSYGRGVGKPMVCAPGLQYDAGLCYNPCPKGQNGIGPVCWGTCPTNNIDCGAICLSPEGHCTNYIIGLSTEFLQFTAHLAACVASGGAGCDIPAILQSIAEIVEQMGMPIC